MLETPPGFSRGLKFEKKRINEAEQDGQDVEKILEDDSGMDRPVGEHPGTFDGNAGLGGVDDSPPSDDEEE